MKLFTKLIGIMIAMLITIPGYAQAPLFSVAKSAGSTGIDRPHAIAVNSNSGDVYVGSEFTGTVDFGGGYILTSLGNVEFGVVKYDSMGNTKWARRGGGTLTDRCYGVGLDNSGNVYITGEYFGASDFGPYNITPAGNLDCIVAKLDSAGTYQWLREGKSVSQVATRGLAVDNNSNVIITGYFGSSSVDTLALDTITLTSYGNRDIFVAKYNSAGEIQWAKNFGGVNSGEEGREVTVDSDGNIYLTGVITGTANFDGIVVNGNLGTDVFVAKLNSSGVVQWAKNGGSNRNDDGAGIAVDNLGNVYVAGKFDSAAVFGTFSVDLNAGLEAFIVKMSPTGDFLWFKHAGGATNDYGADVTLDNSGNPCVLGYFTGTAVIGSDTLTSAGSEDIYLWALSPGGNTNYVKHVQGTGVDRGLAMNADYGGNLYLTGSFQGTINLDLFQFVGAGNDDIFYARLGNNPVPVELISFTASAAGREVTLSWSTATELNNAGFEILRSSDNIAFENIAFVKGKGTSTERNSYSFVDKDLNPSVYYYRLRQMDFDGSNSYSAVIEISVGIPAVFNLSQNYPNPFNPSTEIRFSLPVDASVIVSVYNSIGEKITEYTNDYVSGTYSYSFNGKNLSSGMYLYSINAIGKDGSVFSQSKKMILMK